VKVFPSIHISPESEFLRKIFRQGAKPSHIPQKRRDVGHPPSWTLVGVANHRASYVRSKETGPTDHCTLSFFSIAMPFRFLGFSWIDFS
jgi:hypothetical protein